MNRIPHIIKRLEERFGVPRRRKKGDVLSDLMRTILSQNTNDRNRDTAYEALTARFHSWEAVMAAPVREIARVIRPAGLFNQKSMRIRDILQWIYAKYDSLDLDCICDMDTQQAIDTFTQLKGIGIKTITVVLLFSCGRDVFPVDTHVHRICRRLGLVPDDYTAEKTYWAMRNRVPKGKSYSLHMNFLTLGRTICQARRPDCVHCPLNDICHYALLHGLA